MIKGWLHSFITKHPLLSVLVFLSLLYSLFHGKFKKDENKVSAKFTIDDAKNAILAVKSKYGVEMAKRVEQIFRLETAHFKSGQYEQTGTAGLVQGHWPSPVPKSPTVTFNVNGKPFSYVVWNPHEFADFLAKYINTYNGNYARWNSLDPAAQQKYRVLVDSIKPQFV